MNKSDFLPTPVCLVKGVKPHNIDNMQAFSDYKNTTASHLGFKTCRVPLGYVELLEGCGSDPFEVTGSGICIPCVCL